MLRLLQQQTTNDEPRSTQGTSLAGGKSSCIADPGWLWCGIDGSGAGNTNLMARPTTAPIATTPIADAALSNTNRHGVSEPTHHTAVARGYPVYMPLSTPCSHLDDTLSQPTPLSIGLNQTSPSSIAKRLVRRNKLQHKVKQEEFSGGASVSVSVADKQRSKTSNDVLGDRNAADRPEDNNDDDSGNEASTASSSLSSSSNDASGSVMDGWTPIQWQP